VGEVLVTVHSDTPLAFDEIAVEGLLDEDVNRARWIERRLVTLGL
jgi:hypothetical protein